MSPYAQETWLKIFFANEVSHIKNVCQEQCMQNKQPQCYLGGKSGGERYRLNQKKS